MALKHYGGGHAFCKLEGPAFGIFYIILGVVPTFLALGRVGKYESMSWARDENQQDGGDDQGGKVEMPGRPTASA